MNKSPLVVLLIIILSFINTSAFSNNFEKTDRIVKNYPHSISNPNQLAKLINRDFEMPEDKARAIYTWIATNIVYDIKALKARPKIIHYLYCSDEEKIYRERKIMEDQYCNYEIAYKKNSNTYLTIYINHKPFVTYKILK